jgi:hypothetical protein
VGRRPRSQGMWVVTQDPRFVVSGSRDFRDMALVPIGDDPLD